MNTSHEPDRRVLPDIWHRQSRQTKIGALALLPGIWLLIDGMTQAGLFVLMLAGMFVVASALHDAIDRRRS